MPTRQRLRYGQPIWLQHDAPALPRYPRLTGHLRADIAVVGGGMTGALVAQTFAAAGVSVALVEAALVARGSTAASSALLLEEPDLGLVDLENRYGRRTGRRLWQLSRDAVRDLVALLGDLGIACDLEHRDAVYYASTANAVDRLRREHEHRLRAGFDEEWLSPGALRRITSIAARGAIRTRGSAQFDPYRACLGVLRAAAKSGAKIFERSRVTRIDAERDRVTLRTRRGTIEARRVVIATGYATAYFKPLAGRFRMYRTYVIATRPLTASQRSELGFADVMIWDTERPYHYARWTPGRRLVLGGGDRKLRPGQRRAVQFRTATTQVRGYFETLLPALADLPTAAAWEGLFAMTPDSLPYIGPHRHYPGHWFALGYGGNGMTFGFLAARMLLERWQRKESADHKLFEFSRG